MRNIKVGDNVICIESGVVGTILKFYTPTSCEEQAMVETKDGRKYHAPTTSWKPYKDGLYAGVVLFDECHLRALDMNVKEIEKENPFLQNFNEKLITELVVKDNEFLEFRNGFIGFLFRENNGGVK